MNYKLVANREIYRGGSSISVMLISAFGHQGAATCLKIGNNIVVSVDNLGIFFEFDQ